MDKLRLALVILTTVLSTASSLDCMQCSKAGNWYSEEEQEKLMELCQMGEIEPTPCVNKSHTHCIVSWFRSSGSSEKTVTERRCGTIDDDTGCTLYNSKINRKVRHLLNNAKGTENRRDTSPSFVEVCSQSCAFGGCVNTSPLKSIAIPFIALLLMLR